jgi:predicted ATPase
MTGEDHLTIAHAIARDGICICGDKEPHEFALAYSIGRYERGWSELAIWTETKEELDAADALLRGTAKWQVNTGDRIRIKGEHRAWIAVPHNPVTDAEKRLQLVDAEQYYGKEVPVLILLPEIVLRLSRSDMS